MTPAERNALADRIEAEAPSRELDCLPERIGKRLAIDNESGCWNWNSPNSLAGRGRARVSMGGRPMLHHRAVWTLLRGKIPQGAFLCHHCDNPRCANPDHLYVGDSKTNVRDMFERKRHWTQRDPERARILGIAMGQLNTWAKGAKNPKAKLSPEQVATIKDSDVGSRQLGREYGVNRSTIQRIRNGTAWNS
jgi:hypothetical protein